MIQALAVYSGVMFFLFILVVVFLIVGFLTNKEEDAVALSGFILIVWFVVSLGFASWAGGEYRRLPDNEYPGIVRVNCDSWDQPEIVFMDKYGDAEIFSTGQTFILPVDNCEMEVVKPE